MTMQTVVVMRLTLWSTSIFPDPSVKISTTLQTSSWASGPSCLCTVDKYVRSVHVNNNKRCCLGVLLMLFCLHSLQTSTRLYLSMAVNGLPVLASSSILYRRATVLLRTRMPALDQSVSCPWSSNSKVAAYSCCWFWGWTFTSTLYTV